MGPTQIPVGNERFSWLDSDPDVIEELTTRTEHLLTMADSALRSGLIVAPPVETEIGNCINDLHHVHLAAGYRRHMLLSWS